MSPRAACRLATLGFEHIYDYMPGKVDWLARGLPREGAKADEPQAIDFARQDVAVCELHDRIEEVAPRVAASPYGFGLVISDSGVLLGRLRRSVLEDDPEARAEQVMEPGPSTVRADTAPGALAERLLAKNLTTVLLTDPEGRLMGIVRASDLTQSR